MSNSLSKTVWIDLDNSPHVPFFVPIKNELEKQGHRVVLTARDTFQVIGLADRYGLYYKKVGKHYGSNKILKALGTIWRSIQLAPIAMKTKPDVSISHGSRASILLSAAFRIPSIVLFDYEFAAYLPVVRPFLGIAPEVIDTSQMASVFRSGISTYSGIKEDVYVPYFKPDPTLLNTLDLNVSEILVTIRPPASEAHYHNPDSDRLFVRTVEFIGSFTNVRMVILPRNEKTQKGLILSRWPQWCAERKIIIPEQVLDGLNLMWHSDLVISGGGTMNREAAALGIPVYSIFRGRVGAVDRYLASKGRLVLIETTGEVERKIRVCKKPKGQYGASKDSLVLKQIITAIDRVITM